MLLLGNASMGCGSRASVEWAYTVAMASYCRPSANPSQSDEAAGVVLANRVASCGGQANITESNWPRSAPVASSKSKRLSGCWVIWVTRVPSLTCPPRSEIQASAASGSRALKSMRGSRRLEPPLTAKSESLRTRKKTCPLARSAGVFNAETHSGSIKVVITRGEMLRQRSATDSCGAH